MAHAVYCSLISCIRTWQRLHIDRAARQERGKRRIQARQRRSQNDAKEAIKFRLKEHELEGHVEALEQNGPGHLQARITELDTKLEGLRKHGPEHLRVSLEDASARARQKEDALQRTQQALRRTQGALREKNESPRLEKERVQRRDQEILQSRNRTINLGNMLRHELHGLNHHCRHLPPRMR